jgi:hypothetical protein
MTTYANAPVPALRATGQAVSGRLAMIGRAMWAFLTEIGRRRARPELLRLAASFDLGQPDLAAQLRACARDNERQD